MKWIIFIVIGYVLYLQHNDITILKSKVAAETIINNLRHPEELKQEKTK